MASALTRRAASPSPRCLTAHLVQPQDQGCWRSPSICGHPSRLLQRRHLTVDQLDSAKDSTLILWAERVVSNEKQIENESSSSDPDGLGTLSHGDSILGNFKRSSSLRDRISSSHLCSLPPQSVRLSSVRPLNQFVASDRKPNSSKDGQIQWISPPRRSL